MQNSIALIFVRNIMRGTLTRVAVAILTVSGFAAYAADILPSSPAAAPLSNIASGSGKTSGELLELPSGNAKQVHVAPAATLPSLDNAVTTPGPNLSARTDSSKPMLGTIAALPAQALTGAIAPLSASLPPSMPQSAVSPSGVAPAQEVKTSFSPRILTLNGPPKQQILEEPIHIEDDFSLMFTMKEMDTVVHPSLVLLDRENHNIQALSEKTENGDDLTGLLESFKTKGKTKEIIKPLPHLYLGSIVYYSPSNWSVWVNGKKIVARLNDEKNPLFVRDLDRSGIVLVWKPARFTEMAKLWNEKSASTKTIPKNITVDTAKNSVTLSLRPNQTFIPSTLTIVEGLNIRTEPGNP